MMTDGVEARAAGVADALSDVFVETAPFAHARRISATPAGPPVCLADFAEWFPRLGSVLWLEHCTTGLDSQAHAQDSSTLLTHPALAVLSASRQLRAHQTISAHGPREWLCMHSAGARVEAKLFLLPDSNVLAWDEMNRALQIEPAAADRLERPTHSTFLGRALSRFGQRWQARLLEFRCLQRRRLSVLDARPPLRISLLGIDIARRIVRDEYAEWISPLHSS